MLPPGHSMGRKNGTFGPWMSLVHFCRTCGHSAFIMYLYHLVSDAFGCFDCMPWLPGSLKSITFGADFDQPLDGVILPSGLETLTFGVSFNQSLVQVRPGWVGKVVEGGSKSLS